MIKYQLILLELGEVEKALNFFHQPGYEEEKSELLRFILKSNYLDKHLNKKILKTLSRWVSQVKYAHMSSEYLIKIGTLYAKINEKGELKKVLERALDKSMEMTSDCTRQSFNLGQVFKIYKHAKMEEEAEKTFEKMMSLQKNCTGNKPGYPEKFLVFLNYSDIFIDLNDTSKAKYFLEKGLQLIPKSDYYLYLDNMMGCIDRFLRMKELDRAGKILDQLMDFCSCEQVTSDDGSLTCLKDMWDSIEKSDTLSKIDLSYSIEKLSKKKSSYTEGEREGGGDETEEIEAIAKILILLDIKMKKYDEALQMAQYPGNLSTPEARSEMIFKIGSDLLKNKDHTGAKQLITQLPVPIHRITLYFELGRYYLGTKEYAEAIKVLKEAAALLKKNEIPIEQDVFSSKGADFYSLVGLYRQVNYTRGLLDIQDYYKRQEYSDYKKLLLSEVSVALIDVYIKKKELNAASKVYLKIEDPAYKAASLLYFARYYLNEKNTPMGKKYLGEVYEILENLTEIEYDGFLSEFYRVFLKPKGKGDPHEKLFGE